MLRRRRQLELFLLTLAIPMGMAADVKSDSTTIWVSQGGEVILTASRRVGQFDLCSRVASLQRQPFCRSMPARPLVACGNPDDIIVVLSNGDIYRIDYGLLDPVRGHAPLYRSAQSYEFDRVALSPASCHPLALVPPRLQAHTVDGRNLYFDGERWKERS